MGFSDSMLTISVAPSAVAGLLPVEESHNLVHRVLLRVLNEGSSRTPRASICSIPAVLIWDSFIHLFSVSPATDFGQEENEKVRAPSSIGRSTP